MPGAPGFIRDARIRMAGIPVHVRDGFVEGDGSMQATVAGGTARATLEFRFGADGLVESVYAQSRTYDDGRNPPSQHPWQARVLRHGQVDGATVPVDAVPEWLLPDGAYAYWRGRPLRIAVDEAAPG